MYTKYLLLTILCASISNTTLCPPKRNTRTTPYTTDRPHNGIQCLGCEKVFKNKNVMRNHFTTTHNNTNFICVNCKTGWGNKGDIQKHFMHNKSRSEHQKDIIKIIVHGENREITKNDLSNDTELEEALHVNKKQPSIVCNLCLQSFKSERDWRYHVTSSNHKNSSENLKCCRQKCACLDNTQIIQKLSRIPDKKSRLETLKKYLHTDDIFEYNARQLLTVEQAIHLAKYPSAQPIAISIQKKKKLTFNCTSCNKKISSKTNWLSHITRQKVVNNSEHSKTCYLPGCTCLDTIDIKETMKNIKNSNEKIKLLRALMKNNGHGTKNNPPMLTLGAHVDERHDIIPIAQIYTQSSE